MKTHYAVPLLLSVLSLQQCGSKSKEQAQPSIPANTATVDVEGKPFDSTAATATAVVRPASKELLVTFNATNGSRVVVRLTDFNSRTGRFTITDPASADGPYYTEMVNNRALYFDPRNCSSQNRMVEIIAFDSQRKTISGTFSGTVCSPGSNTRSVALTNGKFNLTYTVQ
ncbi:hypothetical protein LRS06_22335 [Hymenobacter sp. J193]|uniref:hypothetical protein n=1 Tax=Hymenobacter sp. J193 TaxID=2898429 RepID=UPI002150F793|nr:hypothetical protein [Hymenobacter sp. J193]MCR5890312.1 hypothetical protein [Hymenobacter sp. J193]MCR5890470.1 hypothetical protein [Hymenobacter sp. J193]